MRIASVIITGMLLLLSVLCIVLNGFLSPNMASIAGGVLGALATCALGLLAFWQNKQYKQLADEKNAQMEQLLFTPECILLKVLRHNSAYQSAPLLNVIISDTDSPAYCVMVIRTTSQPVIHLLINEVTFRGDNDLCKMRKIPRGSFAAETHEIEYLEHNSEFRVGIMMPSEYKENPTVCDVTLQYDSIYNIRYHKTMSFRYIPRQINGIEINPERVLVLPSRPAMKVEASNATHEI